MRQLFFIVFFFLVFVQILSAQNPVQKILTDSVHPIKEFIFIDNRFFHANPGLQQKTIQSNSVQTLTELLSRNSSVFVRQNGPGLLSSPSIRGTGSAHTAFIWNGLNLQSSMNGQYDLSLIPAALFDEFSLQLGASSASWGTGAIGGSISLISKSSSNHIRFTQYTGSWGFRQSLCDFAFNKGRISLRTRAFNSHVQNNFTFINSSLKEAPKQTQTNADQQMRGLLQDVFVRTGKNSELHLAFWGQESNRKLPPIMLTPIAVAYQTDRSSKTMMSWKVQTSNWASTIRAGFLTEEIRFVDSLIQINANNIVQTSIGEMEFSRKLFSGTSRFQMGYNQTYSKANSAGFGNTWKSQNRKSAFASFKSQVRKMEALIQVRQEWLQSSQIPLIPSLSASYLINKHVKIRSQLAKSYRLPTLNDLNWQPGGNPNLLPEYGSTMELGIDYQTFSKRYNLSIQTGLFSNRIKNWILWVPSGSYWKPENVQQVKSEGLEFSFQLSSSPFKNNIVKLISSIQFLNTQVEKSNSTSSFQAGRQLTYVPQITWNSTFSANLQDIILELNTTYTGLRYTSSDNTSSLPSFFLLNAQFSKVVKYSNQSLTLHFQINNILNTNYQVIAWRPMPLRSFMLGLNFTFTNPKS